MIENADLHIHSPFSMATSNAITPFSLLEACTIKGISVLGCGDALHPEWRMMWEDFLDNDNGVVIVPSIEVQGEKRVHHLILMENFDQCAQLSDLLRPYSKNIDTAGRPHISLSGEDIAGIVHETGGMVGPAHAFTPWTGMYGHFNNVSDCYGEEKIDFLELGLSADSSYGAGIGDLRDVPFLTNSDAHSASVHKLGREFNKIRCGERSVKSVLECIRSGDIVMNAGFFPEEGKYNRTACTRCYRQFSPAEAEKYGWKCPDDKGKIKLGVRDRALLNSDSDAGERPPYLHMIPLGEIIQKILGVSSPETRKCRSLYMSLIKSFGNEISILTDVKISEIREIDPAVADGIHALRSGQVTLYPGGGGKYGSFSF